MSTLKIDMTYQCVAECEHCRFRCTRNTQPVIERELARGVMQDLVRTNGLEQMVLLGGEPGLYPERMLEIIQDAHDLGLRTRLETNGFWASGTAAARAFLRPLRALGSEVMLSLDAFHALWVHPERVATATAVLAEWGINYSIETGYVDYTARSHPSDLLTTQLIANLESVLGFSIAAHHYQGPLFFVGRSSDRLAREAAVGRGVPSEPCLAVPWWSHSEQDTLELLNLDTEGYISKGCGIAFGNVHQDSLERIIGDYDARRHPIIGRLLTHGPLGLVEEAQALGFRLQADYADRCHLCQEVREVLRPKYPQYLAPAQHYR
jgi:hypothetical protein